MNDNHDKARDTPEDRALDYQLDFIKLEFGAINEAIARIDQTTQGTKNWAVIVWAGSIAIALGNKDLRSFVALTSAVPLLFWFIDAQWRRIQRSFIFRSRTIAAFLNGPDLVESMRQRKVVGLFLLDPRATREHDSEAYRRFTSFRRTFRFKEVGPFYFGLVAISVIVAQALRWYGR